MGGMKIDIGQHYYRYGLLALPLMALYHWMIYHSMTDFPDHAMGVVRAMRGEELLPPNFGYYGLVWLLSPSAQVQAVFLAAVAVLTLLTLAKIGVTEYVLARSLPPSWKPYAYWGALLMALVGGLPLTFLLGLSGFFYSGHMWPNSWHNSTMIALMPFAVWLAYRSLRWEGRPSPWTLSGICVLGVWVKPSFFFVWGPAYALLLLASRARLRECIPLLAGVMAMGTQYIMIYLLNIGNLVPGTRTTGIVLAPGAMWGMLTLPWAMPVSVLMGALFPLSVAYVRRGRLSLQWWMGGLMYAGAIAIFFLFMEDGFRRTHANLHWQMIPATYLFYLFALIDYLRHLDRKDSRDLYTYMPLVLFLFQVLLGVWYLYRVVFMDFK